MRAEGEKSKVKRYLLVGKELMQCVNYTSVEEMAERIGMDVSKFRTSVQRAKEYLAEKGIAIINKINKRKSDDDIEEPFGYRITSSGEEYFIEVEKTCKRALSHIGQQIKILRLLKESGQHPDWPFDEWFKVLQHNMMNIIVPGEQNKPDDDDDNDDEYLDGIDYIPETTIVTHHVVYDTPEEMVDPENPDGMN